jgi:hypothetical protein
MMSGHDEDHRRELPEALRELFSGPIEALTGEDCLDEAVLAAWLDETLDAAEHAEALDHLACCRHCQARLVALHHEVAFAWAPDSPLPVVDHRREGELVSWEGRPAGEAAAPALMEDAELEMSKDPTHRLSEERKRRFLSGQS